MRTLQEAKDQVRGRRAGTVVRTEGQRLWHEQLEVQFDYLVVGLWSALPDGPEKTLVLRKLQEAAMLAHLVVDLNTPPPPPAPGPADRDFPLAA